MDCSFVRNTLCFMPCLVPTSYLVATRHQPKKWNKGDDDFPTNRASRGREYRSGYPRASDRVKTPSRKQLTVRGRTLTWTRGRTRVWTLSWTRGTKSDDVLDDEDVDANGHHLLPAQFAKKPMLKQTWRLCNMKQIPRV